MREVLRLRSGFRLAPQVRAAGYNLLVSKSAVAVRQEKGDCMATSDVGFPKATDNQRPGNILTWAVTVLACAYIVWSGTMLYISTPKFMDLYSSLNAELPLATRIVFATYRFGFPLFFGGSAALLIAKQFYVRGKWQSLSITLAALVMATIIAGGIVRALYHPLFEMAEKLNK